MSRVFRRTIVTLFLLVLALIPCALRAADGGTVTFRKVFKSSYPEFVEIKIGADGKGTCDLRQLDEESSPQPLEINPALAQRIFGLAAQLHYFQNIELDVHRRIANLGQKTFRYEKGGETHEVSFNYTLNGTATDLLTIFEGLSRQQGDVADLQRAMRYDRLGVSKILSFIENDVATRALPEPEHLLPALDQIAGDEHFIDLARQKARALAERIREHRK